MDKKYLDNITTALQKAGMDAILVAPSEEMEFILGFRPHLCERFQGLFIKKDGSSFYVCNLLSRDEMQLLLGDEIEVFSWSDSENFVDIVQTAFEKHNLIGANIAVNSTARAFNAFTIAQKTGTVFCDGRFILEQMRIIKNEEEMQALRESSALVDSSFETILKFIKPGVTEKEIVEKIQEFFLSKGIYEFNALACVGKNSSYPHYCKDDGVVSYGDVVLIDWGCRHKNMWSDMSRTVFVGTVTEHQKRLYNIVKTAQQKGIDTAQKGCFVPDVDKVARQVIIDAGYGDTFITRLGHGIGYAIHEAPYISQISQITLDTGMAFSIEPGIYIAGEIGIRIEDVVMIGPNGTEVLNKTTKDLIVIECD